MRRFELLTGQAHRPTGSLREANQRPSFSEGDPEELLEHFCEAGEPHAPRELISSRTLIVTANYFARHLDQRRIKHAPTARKLRDHHRDLCFQ